MPTSDLTKFARGAKLADENSTLRDNPYAAPQVESPIQAELADPGPVGIGGWLILPIIGLIFTPFAATVSLGTQYIPIFTEGMFDRLTDPAFQNYHPLWGPVIILELIAQIIFGCGSIWALVLLFRMRRLFPSVMIAYYILNVVYLAADTWIASQIPILSAANFREISGRLVIALIAAAIWVPYMRLSRRVKNTFVN
jgi:Protein of unknown function (DUF2569)